MRPRSGIIQHEVGQLANTYFGKAFLIGEYDWTTTQSSLPLSDYLNYIESQKPNIGECVLLSPLSPTVPNRRSSSLSRLAV